MDRSQGLSSEVTDGDYVITGDSCITDCWQGLSSAVTGCGYDITATSVRMWRTKRLYASYAEQRQIQQLCDQNYLKVPNNVDKLRSNYDNHGPLLEVLLIHMKLYLSSSHELWS
jgi:hypothetical protein